jgi:acetyl-CoA acetyltransferase family protein
MPRMREAVIIEAVRTPVGRHGGQLQPWHPVDLLAYTLRALMARVPLSTELIDDVIAGCVSQAGEQSLNVARNAALGAGFPQSVPGTTIDRQCGSSQQAIHFAAQAIMSGACDAVIACGVESMSRVPLGTTWLHGPGAPYGTFMETRYRGGLIHQGLSAELVAEKWNLSREALDRFSLESHRRALAATNEGRFNSEIIPVPLSADEMMTTDEGIRGDTSLEKLASLKPAFKDDGVITAGNSSQISDGAAALLIMERGAAEHAGLRPRARFVSFAVTGDDPVLMLTAPISATENALKRAHLSIDEIDLFEINEAFASVVLAWEAETGADLDLTNVNGGAIALGHPLGSTGARLMTTLLHELERRDDKFGLQTMCEGGGLANATIIERIAD